MGEGRAKAHKRKSMKKRTVWVFGPYTKVSLPSFIFCFVGWEMIRNDRTDAKYTINARWEEAMEDDGHYDGSRILEKETRTK